jgi:hypothetical protein
MQGWIWALAFLLDGQFYGVSQLFGKLRQAANLRFAADQKRNRLFEVGQGHGAYRRLME